MTAIRMFLLCSVLALAGCAGGGTAPALFKLDSDHRAPDAPSIKAGAPVLMVEPVTVAPFLDESGLVYQTGPHRVVIADSNRWASPLATQLTGILTTTLQGTLESVQVERSAPRRQTNPAARLTMHVDEFLGHHDGSAHIAGQWQLVNARDQSIAGRSFQRRIALDADGYPALVSSLSRGWYQQIRAMAPRLQRALQNIKPR